MGEIMMNVLITGGSGFIGSNLALKLIEKGYNVYVLDNLSKQIHGDDPEKSSLYCSIKGRVVFINEDIRNKNVWQTALNDIDIVVHLAAETGTGQSMYEIYRYTDININGTANMLNYITNEKNSVRKIIVASSRAIYGEGKYYCKNHGVVYPAARNSQEMDVGDFEVKCPYCKLSVFMLPTDETSNIHPTSVYGITKQMQEELILTCCKSVGINAIAFRYQNVYGPGQSLNNPYTGILSIFSTCLINNKPINIFEDGRESRDFVYIDDVVNATVAGIENTNNEYLSINVGTGVSTSVLTVAETLKNLYGSDSEINITGNYRIGDIRHNNADINLLKDKLNYRSITYFEDGIKNFCKWVKEQKIDKETGSYENSLKEMKEKGLYK
jgi:dTDP-L-rhamnose 4-epimerase